MFFRFIAALALVVLVSMGGVMIEKQILDLRRVVSRQQYQTEILLDRHTALRLQTQELSSPDRILDAIAEDAAEPVRRRTPAAAQSGEPSRYTRRPALPLMNWERPVAGSRYERGLQ